MTVDDHTTPVLLAPALAAAGDPTDLSVPEQSWLDRPDGARIRLGCWPAATGTPDRGVLLLLNGRSEFIEKYAEAARVFAGLGFEVWSLDWRGQGLSSRWLDDPMKGHAADFGVLVDDLAAMIDQAVRPGDRPLRLLGHSMGGHLGLRYLVSGPAVMPVSVALSAPMVDILASRTMRTASQTLAALMGRLGRSEAYALGQGPFDPAVERKADILSADPVRAHLHYRAFVDRPALRVGGVTWGWLDAAARSTRVLFDRFRQDPPGVPILALLAGHESLVSNPAAERLMALAPHGLTKLYPTALHEVLIEADTIRLAVFEDLADHLLR